MAIPYIQVAWTLKGHGAGQDNYGFWWLSKICLYNNNSANNFFTNNYTDLWTSFLDLGIEYFHE